MDPHPVERRLRANGLAFRALEWSDAGPPLLLVHATSFCADVWVPVWRAARAAGAPRGRAVAVDQRGHGGSEAPPGARAFGWDRLAEDVAELASPCGSEPGAGGRVALVGHSSGATACLAAAALRPERVSAVVAVEPVLFEVPASEREDSFAGSRLLGERARARRARFADREAARASLARRFPYSGFAPESLEAFLAGGLEPGPDGELRLRCTPEHESWAYAGAARLDLWPLVGRITAPVHVLRAEHSAVPDALLQRLRDSARCVSVEPVAAATHFAALEQPGAVGAAIARFLAARARS